MSLGNGTTNCMQPPPHRLAEHAARAPFFLIIAANYGASSGAKNKTLLLGHISYLLLLNTYIILSRMMSSDYRFVNQVGSTFFVVSTISIYPIYNVNNNTKIYSWYVLQVVGMYYFFIHEVYSFINLILTGYFLLLITYVLIPN